MTAHPAAASPGPIHKKKLNAKNSVLYNSTRNLIIDYMPAAPTEQSDTQIRWLWPTILISIALAMVAAMIYSQRFVQKVDNIEKKQVAQYESRKFLLAQPDVININWMRTLDPMAKKIYGDIVWSTLSQKGMMRFANLPKLKSHQTYHLWVHDLAYSADDPVSITTFSPELTVPTELLVPFTSPRKVTEPYKFSIMLDSNLEDTPPQPLLLAQP